MAAAGPGENEGSPHIGGAKNGRPSGKEAAESGEGSSFSEGAAAVVPGATPSALPAPPPAAAGNGELYDDFDGWDSSGGSWYEAAPSSGGGGGVAAGDWKLLDDGEGGGPSPTPQHPAPHRHQVTPGPPSGTAPAAHLPQSAPGIHGAPQRPQLVVAGRRPLHVRRAWRGQPDLPAPWSHMCRPQIAMAPAR